MVLIEDMKIRPRYYTIIKQQCTYVIFIGKCVKSADKELCSRSIPTRNSNNISNEKEKKLAMTLTRFLTQMRVPLAILSNACQVVKINFCNSQIMSE